MNQKEFQRQTNARGQELRELEELVTNYSKQIKNVQTMLKGSMVMSFRQGVATCLDYLDNKAKEARLKRDLTESVKQDFLGDKHV